MCGGFDGVLDEPFWDEIEPITNFRQRVPVDGGEPTERTEARIAYDRDNLYKGGSWRTGIVKRTYLKTL